MDVVHKKMEMRRTVYVKKESERHPGGKKDVQGALHKHPSLPSAAASVSAPIRTCDGMGE
jgi:hypothetical protein